MSTTYIRNTSWIIALETVTFFLESKNPRDSRLSWVLIPDHFTMVKGIGSTKLSLVPKMQVGKNLICKAILGVGLPLHKGYPYSLHRWGSLLFRDLKHLVTGLFESTFHSMPKQPKLRSIYKASLKRNSFLEDAVWMKQTLSGCENRFRKHFPWLWVGDLELNYHRNL